MPNPDSWTWSAAECLRRLAARTTSSEALTQAYLERIDALDGKLNAFTHVRREAALLEARHRDLERRQATQLGPLHGLPITVKECFDWKGEGTTVGFTARRHHRAPDDAVLVKLLREAGAVVLGRTNVSQGMIYAETRNPVFGETRNPFSLEHTPGGSSGGEAAALAAGLTPLGFGTDIAGSIRGPAHFSGLCGLAPTVLRWPMRGITPGIPGQETVRATCGPMARSMEDLTLAWQAIDPVRAHQLDPRVPPLPAPAPPESVAGLRVWWWVDDGFMEASPAVRRATREAAEHLADAGCVVVQRRPEQLRDIALQFLAVMSADGARTLAHQLDGGEVDPLLASLLTLGKLPGAVRSAAASTATLLGELSTAEVLRTTGERRVSDLYERVYALRGLTSQVYDLMEREGIDAFLAPPLATPAFPLGGSKDLAVASSYTFVWNALGFPSGVVPVTRVRPGETSGRAGQQRFDKLAARVDAESRGLPVGTLVAARPYQEHLALGLMAAIERGARERADYPTTPITPG